MSAVGDARKRLVEGPGIERPELAEVLDRIDLRDEVKAAIKHRAMDRFTSEYLTDDARAWLAGFAADAALDVIRAEATS